MRILKIEAENNGGHKNQTWDGIPPIGYAVVPDDLDTPNFPFGEITVEKIDGIDTVITWSSLPIPKIEKTQSELREEAYNTQEIIEWDGKNITVTQASELWNYYSAEGNTEKANQLTSLISTAKSEIRQQFPDENEQN